MSMMTEELSLKNKEAVNELKRRVIDNVPPHLKDDPFLYLRFLRARDFNIDVAENMLKNHLIWRKINQIDSILTNFQTPEVVDKGNRFTISTPSLRMSPTKEQTRLGIVDKYMPISLLGFDKEGAPVRYFDFGNMDSKGILKCVKKSVCVKSVIRYFEDDIVVMKEQTQKLGRPIEQWMYILNFENYTFSKATHKTTLEALISLFLAYEANYPERLKSAFIINASVYFTIMFSVIKPLLSGATVSKIRIFGKDGWKEEFLKLIHEKDLPVFLGGKKTDADGNPRCISFIKPGILVPEYDYVINTNKRLRTQADAKKVTVARSSKVQVNLNVESAGSIIEWEFEITGKDIGFELLYKDSDCKDSTKEIVPNHRVETQLVSEVGMYHCEFPGIYTIVFDNTYSWIHQKDVFYKTTIVKPEL